MYIILDTTRVMKQLLSFLLLFCSLSVFSQNPSSILEGPTLEVIGTTPVPGLGVTIDEISNKATITNSDKIHETQSINMTEVLGSQAPSLIIGDVQNNPYQPNIYYRGFISSPLLGAPQGLSVFQDGVRINEPFGDVVNYDLIPLNAISNSTLISGSDPLFGLNTLGGALSMRTKTGADYPGIESQVLTGSWGRNKLDFGYGEKIGNLDYFFAGSFFEEDGWRDFSPSEVNQGFFKVGWENDTTDFDLSYTNVNSSLIGNGVLPVSMVKQRRSQTYTLYDETTNHLDMVILNASHFINDQFLLSGLSYFRGNSTTTYNGDVNDDYESVGDDQGVDNRTSTKQYSHGLSLQLSFLGENHTIENGLTYDISKSNFVQSEQEAEEFTTGNLRFTSNLDDSEIANQLLGRTQTISYYFADRYNYSDDLILNFSGRYNRSRVKADDLQNPGAANNLDANYTYTKFNPSFGFVYKLAENLSTYSNWAQGNRAPTPIELGCADKDNPCSLPNAMAADPFLEQITTQTLEFGVRGATQNGINYNTSVFTSTNKNDILFIAASPTSSQGYFTNFGKTKRMGLELEVQGQNYVDWKFSLSHLQATFEDTACIVSEVNSQAGSNCPDDQIQISPGKEIPGISENVARLNLTKLVLPKLRISTDLSYFSEQWVHGNENNAHQGDDTVGTGKVPSYQIINLRADYKVQEKLSLFFRIDNLLDEDYYNAGILAENSFNSSGNFITDEDDWVNETFYGVGAPRAAWIGLRFSPRL